MESETLQQMPQEAQIHFTNEHRLEILSGDKEKVVGKVHSIRRRSTTKAGLARVAIVTDINIEVESFWGDYALEAHEELIIEDSAVIYYQGQSNENDRESTIVAQATAEGLDINATGDKKSDNFTALLPPGEYDATSLSIGWVFANRYLSRGVTEATLKILDLNDFKIKKTAVTQLDSAELEVQGQRLDCLRLAMKSKRKRTEQWFAQDDSGIWLIKEQGEDSDGKYALRPTSTVNTEN
ncbi:hypothetical protein [Halioxenophilus aromaticivorans]|uniref:DUF5666 domain-containing protein n=1 Tax=Halioxenophilus aromaticivorans TaxID=1306992 RepID=A0AAV3U5N2_9ALTE